MADEALHDIQLNGKQLVFLFMAATIVAVVIFLCGVMVGRGVRAPRLGEPIQIAGESDADPTASTRAPLAIGSSAAGGAGASTTPQETLSYTDRLEAPDPPEETLQEPESPAAPAAARPPALTPAKPAAATASSTKAGAAAAAKTAVPLAAGTTPAPAAPVASAATAEAAGTGFVVQVAATPERGEADTLVRRLASKGYPAFVTTPATGPRIFRVRVGKYTDRREAESVASRLEKEEQFKPWITR